MTTLSFTEPVDMGESVDGGDTIDVTRAEQIARHAEIDWLLVALANGWRHACHRRPSDFSFQMELLGRCKRTACSHQTIWDYEPWLPDRPRIAR